jgi:hypothetical protein
MFSESVVNTHSFAADYTFFRTQNVFTQYEKFLNMDLSIEDESLVSNAITFQIQACRSLVETGDLNEFIFFIEKAYDQYKDIGE